MVKFPQKLEDLYPAGTIEKMLDVLQQPDISGKVRDALEKVGLKDNNPLDQVQKVWNKAKDWVDTVAFDSSTGRAGQSAVINATGRLFYDDCAVLPTNSSAIMAFSRVAESFHLKSVLQQRAHDLVLEALNGVSVSFLSGVASAIEELVAGRRLLVAKCDLLRIPGVGDLSSLIERLEVVEVGAVNGCNQDDWQEAADSESAILLLSPNTRVNDARSSFREQAILAGNAKSIPVYELAVDATFNVEVASTCGFSNPLALIEQGVHAVVVPLDKFIGAPVGAAVVSNDQSTLDGIRRRAALRNLDLQGPSLAAAAIALQANCEEPMAGDLNAMLLSNPENLQNRAERIAGLIENNGVCGEVEIVQKSVPQGPSPWDTLVLDGWAITAEVNEAEVGELAERLAAGSLPARQDDLEDGDDDVPGEPRQQARILTGSHGNKLEIDLRYVNPRDDHRIAMALSAAEFDTEH